MKKINVYTLLFTLLSVFSLNAQEVALTVPDKVVDSGQIFTIDIKASDFDSIELMQFALFWNPSIIQFQAVTNLNPNLPDFSPTDNFNFMHAAEGRFRTIWFWIDPVNNTGVSLADDATLFSIKFKAIGVMGTSSLVEIGPDTTGFSPLPVEISSLGQPVAVFIDNGKVNIGQETASSEIQTDDFTLFQNSPNPFSDLTYISFNLHAGTEGKLTIFDTSGKLVYQENKKYPAGLSRIPVRRDMLTSAGSYFYTLETARATATRQLIMQ